MPSVQPAVSVDLLDELSIVKVDAIATIWSGVDHCEGIAAGPDGVIWAGGEDGQIYRGTLAEGYEHLCSIPARPLGFVVSPLGVAYCASIDEPGLYRIEPSGEFDLLSRGSPGRPAKQPNHPALTTTGDIIWSDSGEWGADDGCLWITHLDGSSTVFDESCCRFPNGLAMSSDRRHLAVVESTLPGIALLDLAADGTPGRRHELLKMPGFIPDGVAWDANGDLLISCWTPDAILVRRSSGHTQLVAHDPQRFALNSPTNIAFVPGTRTVVASSYGERCLSLFEWTTHGAIASR